MGFHIKIQDRQTDASRQNLNMLTLMRSVRLVFFCDILEKSLKVNSSDIINLANSEGLHSHAKSVKIRFEN